MKFAQQGSRVAVLWVGVCWGLDPGQETQGLYSTLTTCDTACRPHLIAVHDVHSNQTSTVHSTMCTARDTVMHVCGF